MCKEMCDAESEYVIENASNCNGTNCVCCAEIGKVFSNLLFKNCS